MIGPLIIYSEAYYIMGFESFPRGGPGTNKFCAGSEHGSRSLEMDRDVDFYFFSTLLFLEAAPIESLETFLPGLGEYDSFNN